MQILAEHPVIYIGTTLINGGKIFPGAEWTITNVKWESTKQKIGCNTTSSSKLRTSLFQHLVLDRETLLTSLQHRYCFTADTLPKEHSTTVNAKALQMHMHHSLSLVIRLHISKAPFIQTLSLISLVAVLLDSTFLCDMQTLWKWLSDQLHCLEIFSLSTINKITEAQQVARNPRVTLTLMFRELESALQSTKPTSSSSAFREETEQGRVTVQKD